MVVIHMPLVMATTRLIRATHSTAPTLTSKHLIELLHGHVVRLEPAHTPLLITRGTLSLVVSANTLAALRVPTVQSTGSLVEVHQGLLNATTCANFPHFLIC